MRHSRNRGQLTNRMVLDQAIAIADCRGLEALTMRSLGKSLGVEAMSLYHYFANKTELLDAMIDAVFSTIESPPTEMDWRSALRRRAVSTRAALIRHPWALGLMESRRAPGLSILRHHDAVIGCLVGAGFGLTEAAHAYSLLDSYIFGFALQEASLPFASGQQAADLAKEMFDERALIAFPHLAALAKEVVMRPGYEYAAEFEIGLDLVMESLDRLRNSAPETLPRKVRKTAAPRRRSHGES